MRLPVNEPHKARYVAKDQKKADLATCFIGRGSANSSTEAYRKAYGPLANKGQYTNKDIVFVSVEGNRVNRVPIDHDEVRLALAAGARIVCDNDYHRNRPYNVGERELYELLLDANYACYSSNQELAVYGPRRMNEADNPAHPEFWRNTDDTPVTPLEMITAQDIRDDKYVPVNPAHHDQAIAYPVFVRRAERTATARHDFQQGALRVGRQVR